MAAQAPLVSLAKRVARMEGQLAGRDTVLVIVIAGTTGHADTLGGVIGGTAASRARAIADFYAGNPSVEPTPEHKDAMRVSVQPRRAAKSRPGATSPRKRAS
jgi:hypothetical protein